MWPIGLIMQWSLPKHVFSIFPCHHGVLIKALFKKGYKWNSGKGDCRGYFDCSRFCLRPWITEAQIKIWTTALCKSKAVQLNSFFAILNVLFWDLKCWCEIFLLILSVSPDHAVPLGWGISTEKRKPLPHYAANFRHQEKMFGNSWPRFQVLEWYPLCSQFPWVKKGWFWYLSKLKETIYNIYNGTSKVSYQSQASNVNDSIWNSNFLFTVIRGIFFH